MICKKCGSEMPEGMRFCGQCGGAMDAPAVTEEPKTEAPAVEAPKAQMPDWMHDNWVPEMPVIEAPAPKGRQKKQAPSAQAPASPTVAPADPFAVPPADPFAVPSQEQETKKPKKAKKKRTGLRVVAALLIVAILAGIGGWVLLTYETVYVMTEVRHYDENGVNTELRTYDYDRKGRMVEAAYYKGKDTQEVWDDDLMLYTTVTTGEISDDPYLTVKYKYDKDGCLTEERNKSASGDTSSQRYKYKKKNGLVTELETVSGDEEVCYVFYYDKSRRVKEICTVDGNGEETFYAGFAYDTWGRMTEYEIFGRTYEYTYEKGRLVEVATTGGDVYGALEYEYDSKGNLLSITTNEGDILCECEYDSKGNPEEMDLQGIAFTFESDGKNLTDGEMVSSGTKLKYDKHGNITKRVYSDGSSDEFEYKWMFLTKKDAARYYTMYSEMEYRQFTIYKPFRYIVNLPMDPKWELRRLFAG